MLVVVGVVGLAGCSSGGGTPASSATPTPQAQQPTPAAVAAGMRKIDQIAQDIAASAGTDKARAADLASQIEPAWKPIEDTVKQNDQNTYLTMEDNFAVLEKAADNGDTAAAAKGAAAISPAVQDYLARYPG
jgi:hypothetical protein